MAEYDFINNEKNFQNIWMRTDFIIPLALCIPQLCVLMVTAPIADTDWQDFYLTA